MDNQLWNELREISGEENVHADEPMSSHTTFRIGGPADLYIVPRKITEIARLADVLRSCCIPYFILGNGSNLLVSDRGFRGVVIQIGKNLNHVEAEGTTIRAEAGALLSRTATAACEHGLTGMEFASGIPGTVGGACVMNAGAYGGEIGDILKSVTILDENDSVRTLSPGEMLFGYRCTRVQFEPWIVLGAEICLTEGDQDQIRARMNELKEKRTAKQPLEYPSAGSTFKRPEGFFAGKLISDAGLRGYRVGGAQVSEKHCGFVINRGGATAADVLALIRHVQDVVGQTFGVHLEPEIRMLGFGE